ncbi:MAG: signal peptidase I [Acidobacteriota bacterium]|jgi:signal peptidase I|nr:signal peptidase I [Acidobacteriota bacterium]
MRFLPSQIPVRPALWGIVLAAFCSAWWFGLVAAPVRVEGTSMTPSLAPHQRLIVSPLLARWDLRRFDLVVITHPRQAADNLVKRVVALPGDRLTIDERGIFVNNRPISYWTAGSCTPFMKIIIPKRHVFVLGDNLDNSRDSRAFGPVPISSVRGKVVLRYWPFSRIGIPR